MGLPSRKIGPIMQFVDRKPEIEYLAGRAVPKVSPKTRHSLVQLAVGRILYRLTPDRGLVGTEWRFYLESETAKKGKTELVPDVALLSRDRYRTLQTDDERERPPFAPDVAVEIRSSSDRQSNVLWKMNAYLQKGTLVAMDVLPLERKIVAYEAGGVCEFRDGETFTCEALPWLRFDVAEAFADLD